MKNRLPEVSAWLKEQKVDFVFINSVPNVFYLSGFSCRPFERLLGLLVFQDMDPVLIYPQLEAEQVKSLNWKYGEIGHTDNENPWEMIRELLINRGFKDSKAFSIEENVLSYYRTKELKTMFPSASIIPIDEKLNTMRLIKNEQEIEHMADAARLADYAIELGLESIKEGCTELDIVAEIQYKLMKKGIRDMGSPLVLFGDNSSLPHGIPGENRLQKGDFIMIDLGVKVGGYCSDITRTCIYGSGDEQKKEIYDIVLKANMLAIESCQIGTRIGKLDEIARDIIVEAGYGEYYPHRVGHGIGLEGHEYPSMNSKNQNVLTEGMVFTIEPGIYIPGVGGVRIEDEVLITKNGPTLLTKHRKDYQVINSTF